MSRVIVVVAEWAIKRWRQITIVLDVLTGGEYLTNKLNFVKVKSANIYAIPTVDSSMPMSNNFILKILH